MNIDKHIIKRSFSRAASTYDSNSALQKEVVDEIFSRFRALLGVSESPYPQVLDIGSGTGRLMGLVKSGYPEASVIGCDLALTMLCKSRENLGNLTSGLAVSDCEALPFSDLSFDAVVSSLTYQWAHDIGLAFSEAARVLKQGGIFLFSTLGPGTLHELRECYPSGPSYKAGFKTADEIASALKMPGLVPVSMESFPIRKTYPDMKELLRTLKNIGASPPLESGKGLAKASLIRNARKVYPERFPSPQGGIIATYEVIIAAARK